MSSRPLITVVTVCYKSVEYIECCMKSVMSQDFTDFEYVVIDGGSDDGTVDIIKKHQNRISYWHSRVDNGLADAFNMGIENSCGKWLLFLNSDDFLAGSTVLSRMSHFLKTWPTADVVMGQIMLMTRERNPRFKSGPHGKPFTWNELRFKAIIPHQAAFTNRNYFKKVGLFNLGYHTIMDYEHFLRGGPRIDLQFVPVVVSCMRDGGQSKNDIKKGLIDLKRAQIETRALPTAVAEINRIYLFVRNLFSRTFLGKPWRAMRNRRLQRSHSFLGGTFYKSK